VLAFAYKNLHQRIAKALGEHAIIKVENHQNFAWKELLRGERKGKA